MVARMQAPRPLHYTLGVSALGHGVFLLLAFFVFKAAVEPMQVRDIGESVQFETIAIPHALFAPPPAPEPEELPAVAPVAPEEEAAPVEKTVRKAVKRRKVRKQVTAEPEMTAAPVVEGGADSKVAVPAPAGPAGAVDEPGLARSGAATGDKDTFSKVRQKLPVAQKVVVDRNALTRGYVGRISGLLRKGKKYPRAAQRAREEGKVIVEVVIDGSGRIVSARVLTSSGSRTLDDAAIAHVKALKKLPAPPSELGWTRKSFRVPFNYRIRR